MPFEPNYRITLRTATHLMRIEAARQAVDDLPITSSVLAGLRETAKLFSTHYSTMIEGNRLTREEVSSVIERKQHFPGLKRDETEVLGYYAAIERLERFAAQGGDITDLQVRTLHAQVMAGGKAVKKASPYRGGQNVIRDSGSRRIVYMPPESSDIARLMSELLDWLRSSEREDVPCPIRAGIAHYQFATIHPYYDGNGRTARLLTTLILHRGGYDLKGIYSESPSEPPETSSRPGCEADSWSWLTRRRRRENIVCRPNMKGSARFFARLWRTIGVARQPTRRTWQASDPRTRQSPELSWPVPPGRSGERDWSQRCNDKDKAPTETLRRLERTATERIEAIIKKRPHRHYRWITQARSLSRCPSSEGGTMTTKAETHYQHLQWT